MKLLAQVIYVAIATMLVVENAGSVRAEESCRVLYQTLQGVEELGQRDQAIAERAVEKTSWDSAFDEWLAANKTDDEPRKEAAQKDRAI